MRSSWTSRTSHPNSRRWLKPSPRRGSISLASADRPVGDRGTLALVTDNEVATQRVLTDGGWKFRSIEVVETSLPNKPGTLAEAARQLGKAGINIEAAFPTGMTGSNAHIVFATDNPAKAKQVLREPVGATSR